MSEKKVGNVEELRRLAVYYKHVAAWLREASDAAEVFADMLNHAADLEEQTKLRVLEVGEWLGRRSE